MEDQKGGNPPSFMEKNIPKPGSSHWTNVYETKWGVIIVTFSCFVPGAASFLSLPQVNYGSTDQLLSSPVVHQQYLYWPLVGYRPRVKNYYIDHSKFYVPRPPEAFYNM